MKPIYSSRSRPKAPLISTSKFLIENLRPKDMEQIILGHTVYQKGFGTKVSRIPSKGALRSSDPRTDLAPTLICYVQMRKALVAA